MRHYCTLFDRNYLAKGLAMYESLRRWSSNPAFLHVLAMDHDVQQAMTGRPGVQVYGFMETVPVFSNARTWQEVCWTCASTFLDQLFASENLGELTYLDADLFFFSDPEPVFEEIGKRSIGIIEHRLIPEKRHLIVNGRFNVGMVHFKNTEAGRACLSRWAAQVRERCDESTCGDQKYLDEWPDRYGDEACIIQNIGANVAPWNLRNWALTEGPRVDGENVVFYHAHEYEHGVRLTNYELRPEDIEFIYKPYIAAIEAASEQIARVSLQTS